MKLEETVAKVKPSIALIVMQDGDNISKGTGFVFHHNNLLVTCNHVVKGESPIIIRFPDSDAWYNAKVTIRDEEHDLAILKFDGIERQPLEDSKGIKIVEGMSVIFAGYPLDIANLTTHQGIISAKANDPTGTETYLIDGTVNPGNSGCPLMTADGKVIGVVNATSRQQVNILDEVQQMSTGTLTLHGLDVVNIFNALANNLQLGIGFAVPSYYIPQRVDKPKAEAKKK